MLISLLILGLLLFLLTRTLFFLVQVEGWSMYPTYNHGDRLLALRYWPRSWLRQSQIVVWKLSVTLPWVTDPKLIGPELYVKRIIGLPGDEVVAPIAKPRDPLSQTKIPIQETQELQKWYVPAGHCFVKGDSPGFDSTVFGPIPLHCIRGVILARLRQASGEPQIYTVSNIPEQIEKVDKL